MAEPFLSEIRIFGFGFAPRGWALCNGQLLPINQNTALFSLLQTIYGGDGQTNFALPNMQGSVPIHFGQHTLGERGGEQSHTLTIPEIPNHTHTVSGTADAGDTVIPGDNLLGSYANLYGAAANPISLIPGTVGNIGGSQGHENMQPWLVLNFSIALQGIYPSQN